MRAHLAMIHDMPLFIANRLFDDYRFTSEKLERNGVSNRQRGLLRHALEIDTPHGPVITTLISQRDVIAEAVCLIELIGSAAMGNDLSSMRNAVLMGGRGLRGSRLIFIACTSIESEADDSEALEHHQGDKRQPDPPEWLRYDLRKHKRNQNGEE